ncbi:MAG: potassium-transporting ATPase subunit KdpC [Methylococcaceae bacterium]|nr:potassium-transporting ATPase subunit KdpC [Methylococcaceae bacterium]
MTQHIKPALIMLLFFTVLTGIAYPLLVTFGAQHLFPIQANGSLIVSDKRMVGSELIGQTFTQPDYFWGRPSATSPNPYNAAASSGSNLGPSNSTLVETVTARIAALQALDPDNKTPIPVDLITASGSGLDPNISPAATGYQINRIAKVRKIDPNKLQELVLSHTEGRQWGLLGEPRVNVLALNLALDANQVAHADVNATDFTLPPSKVYIEICQKEALRLHPGELEKERMLHRHGDFWVESEIQTIDGSQWLVLCDLTTGKVMREQKLIDDQ